MGNRPSRVVLLLSSAAVVAEILRRSRTKRLKASLDGQQQSQRGVASAAAATTIPARPSRPPPSASPTATAASSLPPRPMRPPPPVFKDPPAEVWICLDFEWTCDDGEKRQVSPADGEIIEFSYVVYDAKAGAVVSEGQHYCKNLRTPITSYCTGLTKIKNETLEGAGSLQYAIGALEAELAKEGLAGRPCCAVAHGSADLELMLPRNCKELGIQIPSFLRRYVDLRVAAQTHVAAQGADKRASTLRQICEALGVQMMGTEHCGLDDSWNVLLAMQQLLKVGADLQVIDVDEERTAFLNTTSGSGWSLCLDGLPFFAVSSELTMWLGRNTGRVPPADALWVVLGNDGRPSGRAVLDFDSHAEAAKALQACELGRCIVCRGLDGEQPSERLVLMRPIRGQERILPRRPAGFSGDGPHLTPFPKDLQDITSLRISTKGKGKGAVKAKVEASTGRSGHVKVWNNEKFYGFIMCSEGDVFFHRQDCVGMMGNERFRPGELLTFDVIEDVQNGKAKAINVQRQAE